MSAVGPEPDWAAAVISFLSANTSPLDDDERPGWEHRFTTACQFGCEALVALGQADGNSRGALRRAKPEIPEVLPRWDDICVAVLKLAEQRNKLSYLRFEKTVPLSPFDSSDISASQADNDNRLPLFRISAVNALGPAEVEPDVMEVLNALGLIANGKWTSTAEAILWRVQPNTWNMDVTSDPRFGVAVKSAIETLPDDIRAQIDSHLVKKKVSKVRINGELDWIFYRRWRFPDGWLSVSQSNRALDIFHDPLARQVRQAVIKGLYPRLPGNC